MIGMQNPGLSSSSNIKYPQSLKLSFDKKITATKLPEHEKYYISAVMTFPRNGHFPLREDYS